MIEMEFDIDMRPKARPCLRKFGNIYQPKDHTETALAQYMTAFMLERNILMIPRNIDIVMSAAIWITHLAGDIDNILKAIMDAGNKIIYNDDKQITGFDEVRIFRRAPKGKVILKYEPKGYML